jgi:formylglycine-generating enzyme required for sulfatase activity
VTFADYARFAESTNRELPHDSGWGREDRPVIDVTWRDALAYAHWLSDQTGQAYRLPTEREWEYAARAGTETPFWTGDCVHTDQVNYDGDYDYAECGAKTGYFRGHTVPVGSLPANPWGVHEILGNVLEFTCSAYDNLYYGSGSCAGADYAGSIVLRGGAWSYEPSWVRAGVRNWLKPDIGDNNFGFRLAKTISPEHQP